MTTKKTGKKTLKNASARKSTPTAPHRSLPKQGKDPKGGLTAAGRRFFAKSEGSHLRPGVKGPADTPEKMKRKGSFLTRHYANPRGPVVRDGKPTRQALQAAAWGEPVPRSESDEKKLAAKGRALLHKFHEARGDALQKKAPKKTTGA
jgi:hypothetical protein